MSIDEGLFYLQVNVLYRDEKVSDLTKGHKSTSESDVLGQCAKIARVSPCEKSFSPLTRPSTM